MRSTPVLPLLGEEFVLTRRMSTKLHGTRYALSQHKLFFPDHHTQPLGREQQYNIPVPYRRPFHRTRVQGGVLFCTFRVVGRSSFEFATSTLLEAQAACVSVSSLRRPHMFARYFSPASPLFCREKCLIIASVSSCPATKRNLQFKTCSMGAMLFLPPQASRHQHRGRSTVKYVS